MDLAGNERLSSSWRFVVEKNPVAGIHAVRFTVVDRDPVGVELGDSIGAAGIEGRRLFLRNFLHKSVQLTCACLIEACFLFESEKTDGLQQAECSNGIDISRVFRCFKADRHMALGSKVVHLIGLDFSDEADKVAAVGKVAVVEVEVQFSTVGILKNMINAFCIKR